DSHGMPRKCHIGETPFHYSMTAAMEIPGRGGVSKKSNAGRRRLAADRAREESAGGMRGGGDPFCTDGPGLGSLSTPTAWSIFESREILPPPRSRIISPMIRASQREIKPDCGDLISTIAGA